MKRKPRTLKNTAYIAIFGLIVLFGTSSASAETSPEAVPKLPERIPSDFEIPELPEGEPSPEENPEQCLIEGKMKWTWGYGNQTYNPNQVFQKSGDADSSACLADIVNDVRKVCQKTGAFVDRLHFGVDSPTHSHYADDCFVQTLALTLFPDFKGNSHKVGRHSNGAVCTDLVKSDLKFCPPELGGVMRCVPCGSGKVYLDSSCNVVPPSPEMEICGGFTTNYQASSPISLIWDESVDLESETTAVQFPLDSALVGKWYQWKASGATPLLVYDPKHQGRITTAAQLFGHWTFGGKQVASIGGKRTSSRWKHGYEALATLDVNNDRVISGKELAPLGLWFDFNRDGISQDGEVKPLHSTGVKKLFLGISYRDPQTKSLWVNKGFERVTEKGTVIGRSVDWFGEVAGTPLELSAQLNSSPAALDRFFDSEQELDSNNAYGAFSDGSRLSGIWEFNFEGVASTDSPAGYLFISDRGEKDGSFSGYSIVNKSFRIKGEPSENGLTTMVSLSGNKIRSRNGAKKLRFVINNKGMEIRSSAAIEQGVMKGRSSVINSDGRKISYRWYAKRQM